MKTAYCARALTKHSFGMGAPIGMVAPCYLIPAVLGLAFGLWETFLVGIIVHIWLRMKYRKDEYWFSYLIESLQEEQDLEP